MIDYTEIQNGELWELFARDFLQEIGFYIESTPDRGPDGGKDLLVSEEIKGKIGNYRYRWLVSCKHFASGNVSVKEPDEINIQERVEGFNADGFIGFYSTLASSGLNTRVRQLRDQQRIKDYKIFDGKLIENYMIRIGFSTLLMRYFPKSYVEIKPIQKMVKKYIPLLCKVCEKDLLLEEFNEDYQGNIVFVEHEDETDRNIIVIDDVYCVCKGDCDRTLEIRNTKENQLTGWEDLTNLLIPIYYLQWIFCNMNGIRQGRYRFTDKAYKDLKMIIIALSQKTLREMTKNEKFLAAGLIEIGRL